MPTLRRRWLVRLVLFSLVVASICIILGSVIGWIRIPGDASSRSSLFDPSAPREFVDLVKLSVLMVAWSPLAWGALVPGGRMVTDSSIYAFSVTVVANGTGNCGPISTDIRQTVRAAYMTSKIRRWPRPYFASNSLFIQRIVNNNRCVIAGDGSRVWFDPAIGVSVVITDSDVLTWVERRDLVGPLVRRTKVTR